MGFQIVDSLPELLNSANVVIGGKYQELDKIYFKVASVSIPEKSSLLKDPPFEYCLYGTTNFDEIDKMTNYPLIRTDINSLRLCEGIILPYSERSHILDIP